MPQLVSAATANRNQTSAHHSPFGNFFRWGADFFYPRHCGFCLDSLAADESGPDQFCQSCRTGFLSDSGNACAKCGAAVGPHVDLSAGCNDCLREKFAFEQVIRLGVYRDDLRRACLRAKRPRQEPQTAGLATLVWECRRQAFQDAAVDIVIPVPHYWLQRLFCPHNPAETLATVWANTLKARKSSHILLKARWTRPQRSLPAARRRQNVRHAFKVVRAEEIKDATVLLVDDIMTTGATANEAARVLKQAGAKRIVTAVVARAIRVR